MKRAFQGEKMSDGKNTDYYVADMSLAEWGHKEIAIAEKEMPGLMALRKKYGQEKYQSLKEKSSQIRFLQSRGFSFEEINSSIEN